MLYTMHYQAQGKRERKIKSNSNNRLKAVVPSELTKKAKARPKR